MLQVTKVQTVSSVEELAGREVIASCTVYPKPTESTISYKDGNDIKKLTLFKYKLTSPLKIFASDGTTVLREYDYLTKAESELDSKSIDETIDGVSTKVIPAIITKGKNKAGLITFGLDNA
jgi:hypothetical protein